MDDVESNTGLEILHDLKFGETTSTGLAVVDLGDFKHEEMGLVAKVFKMNASRVQISCITPVSLLYSAMIIQEKIDEARLAICGDLRPISRGKPPFDEVMAAFTVKFNENADAFFLDKGLKTNRGHFLFCKDLLDLLAQAAEVRVGLLSILSGMVTGTWTAFEVLAGDLWEAALNVHPVELAELRGKSSKSMSRPKPPFSALVSPDDDKKPSAKSVRMDYLQAHGYDLSHRMGTVQRQRFNFQVLEGIRDAYIQAFDEPHVEVREAILHPILTALAATRNVLTHKAGVVDGKFLEDCERCEELRALFPDAQLGKPLPITGANVRDLIRPAISQSINLIKAVKAFVENDGEKK